MQEKTATAQGMPEPESKTSRESLYRTKWLMAHNRLHDIVHSKSNVPLAVVWDEYLKELQSSEVVAETPA